MFLINLKLSESYFVMNRYTNILIKSDYANEQSISILQTNQHQYRCAQNGMALNDLLSGKPWQYEL